MRKKLASSTKKNNEQAVGLPIVTRKKSHGRFLLPKLIKGGDNMIKYK